MKITAYTCQHTVSAACKMIDTELEFFVWFEFSFQTGWGRLRRPESYTFMNIFHTSKFTVFMCIYIMRNCRTCKSMSRVRKSQNFRYLRNCYLKKMQVALLPDGKGSKSRYVLWYFAKILKTLKQNRIKHFEYSKQTHLKYQNII